MNRETMWWVRTSAICGGELRFRGSSLRTRSGGAVAGINPLSHGRDVSNWRTLDETPGSGKRGNLTSLVVGATTATLTDKAGVSLRRIIEHRSEAIMEIYSPSQFAEKHGVSASRIRQLLAEDRIFPRQKTPADTGFSSLTA